MSRPVQYNIYGQTQVKLVKEMPDGMMGEGFFATSLNQAVGLARKNSMWPLPFATSCCGIEFMATMGAHYDISRFGSERPSFSPRQADLLMVMGTIAKKMAPIVKQVYLQDLFSPFHQMNIFQMYLFYIHFSKHQDLGQLRLL